MSFKTNKSFFIKHNKKYFKLKKLEIVKKNYS